MANDIIIDIGANDRATRILRDVSRNIGKFSQNTQREFKKLNAAAGALTGVLRGLTAAAASYFSVRQLAAQSQYIDNLAKTARLLDININNLQAFRKAAEEVAGVDTRTTDTALRRIQRRIAEAAQGRGEAIAALQRLNLDPRSLMGMPTIDRLKAIANAMRGVSNETEQLALMFKLADSEGVPLLNLFRQGGRVFDQFRDQIDQTGKAISELQAQQVEQMNDAIGRMTDSFSGLGTVLLSSVAPALQKTAEGLRAVITAARDLPTGAEGFVTSPEKTFADILGIRSTKIRTDFIRFLKKQLRPPAPAAGPTTPQQDRFFQRTFGGTGLGAGGNVITNIPFAPRNPDAFFGLAGLARSLPLEMLRRLGQRGQQRAFGLPQLAATESRLMAGGGRQDPLVKEVKEQKVSQQQFNKWVRNTLWPQLQLLLAPDEDQLEVKVVRR